MSMENCPSVKGRKEKLRHVMKGMNDQVLSDQDMEVVIHEQCALHRGVGTRSHPPLLHYP